MEQQEHIQKLADEYYEEGRARFFDHKLEEAAMLVQNALHLYKKCDDMMAVDYLVEGLECAIDYQLNNITTLFYNNIGSRYQELGEHEKAIDYFLKSARELQNPTCIKEERHRSDFDYLPESGGLLLRTEPVRAFLQIFRAGRAAA